MNYIKKSFVCAVAAGTATLATATPVVGNVTMSQGNSGRLVTITYTLTEDAVVTLDVQTNATPNAATGWASIGGEAVCNAKGAVWRKVTSADADGQGKYTITWRPDLSWTDANGKGFNIANGCAKAVVTAWSLDNTPNYMVVDISEGALPNTQHYYCSTNFLPGGLFGNDDYRTSKIVMRKIMAKDVKWTMGSVSEAGRESAREKTHPVQLTNNYYIGVFELTQSQFILARKGSSTALPTPSFNLEGYKAMRPMEQLSYNELRATGTTSPDANALWPNAPGADSLLGLLRAKTNIDFDLPTDAEWEFACRAGNGEGKWGNGAVYQNMNTDSNLPGRYKGNSGTVSNMSTADASVGTAIVGIYAPNDWGLYDMHGNVYEWCLDWYADDVSSLAYSAEDKACIAPINVNLANPSSPAVGTSSKRVIHSGAYSLEARYNRSAFRNGYEPHTRNQYLGVRLACRAGLK